MGFVVAAPEVRVRTRYYRGSMLWSFGLREVIWIVSILFMILIPRLFLANIDAHHFQFEYFLYFIGGIFTLQMIVLFWSWSSKWVATLRPSGIEYRSGWMAQFGWGRWKKASWAQVESLRSTKTYERDGVVSTWGIQLDIHDADAPTGLYTLRISAGEFSFMEYLEALVRWTDAAKVDPDLRRILETPNLEKLTRSRNFGKSWGLVLGLLFGVTLFATHGMPSSERWTIFGGVWVVAMVAGYSLRTFRKK